MTGSTSISFSPCLPAVCLYAVLRKEGTTLDRRKLCTELLIPEDVFDYTLSLFEAVFPDYSTCFSSRSWKEYRETAEAAEEKRAKSGFEREVTCSWSREGTTIQSDWWKIDKRRRVAAGSKKCRKGQGIQKMEGCCSWCKRKAKEGSSQKDQAIEDIFVFQCEKVNLFVWIQYKGGATPKPLSMVQRRVSKVYNAIMWVRFLHLLFC